MEMLEGFLTLFNTSLEGLWRGSRATPLEAPLERPLEHL
jgi:hypothetical protein